MAERIGSLPGPLPTVFYFLVSLFPLVIAHELGHFVAAKLCRVRVDEFGIGFPPRLARIARIGETEYSVNLLPLGGFVKLAGEDDPSVPGAFAGRGKAVRGLVLVSGPIANFAFAALVFASMAWTGLIPEALYNLDGARVTRVDAGSPADEAGLRAEDVILAVDGRSLAAPDAPAPGPGRAESVVTALVERTDRSAARPMTLTVLRADISLIDTTTPLTGVEWADVGLQDLSARQVVSAPSGSVLAVGDLVLDRTSSGTDLGGKLAVLSDARVVSVVVVPRSSGPGQPARMGVQITAPSVPVRFGIAAGAIQGVRFTGSILRAMVTALARMVSGHAEVQLTGPVGISVMSRQMGEQGLVPLLEFMALLSLNLGLINLLPFPALDGGRLLFILAEALRGKRIEPSREALVHLIGFVAVIGLMAVLTLIEVARLTGVSGP